MKQCPVRAFELFIKFVRVSASFKHINLKIKPPCLLQGDLSINIKRPIKFRLNFIYFLVQGWAEFVLYTIFCGYITY